MGPWLQRWGSRLDRRTLGRLRLASQRLLPDCSTAQGAASIAETVRWMTAMQAQDLQAAMWAVGVRVPGAGLADVRPPWIPVRSPLVADARNVAPAGSRGPALDAEPHRRTAHQGHRGPAPRTGHRVGDIEKSRDLARWNGWPAAVPSAARSSSRPSTPPGSPPRASAASTSCGLCAGTAGWCRGRWRETSSCWWTFDHWIPVQRRPERQEAIAEFAAALFPGHGPATMRDFAWWTRFR
jgi:hypothetical protein